MSDKGSYLLRFFCGKMKKIGEKCQLNKKNVYLCNEKMQLHSVFLR